MVETCITCELQYPSCLMYETKKGEEKYCMGCEQNKKSIELDNINDVSNWWECEKKYRYKKNLVNNAAILLQKVWRKYLRSDTAKNYWSDIRFKTHTNIWSDYSDSSDSE